MSDFLSQAFPAIGRQVRTTALAELPTPVVARTLSQPAGSFDLWIKRDDISSASYGGNKVRKLEYLLQRAVERGARRVATFGAAGSNHALATAVHATTLGLACTCFLSHQRPTPKVARTLNMHRKLGTEIVYWTRSSERLATYRRYLQHRNAWVIPLGGTCWRGCVGFVNAGLELAQQVRDGELPRPTRIYMAAGTTGSVAGLALGLAAAGLDTEIHAVRVADEPFGGPAVLDRVMAKTALLLRRIDASFPTAEKARPLIAWRDDFLAGGYARVDDVTRKAVALADTELHLDLETTYTGKALAALLHDRQQSGCHAGDYLFWNTHNSRALPVGTARPGDAGEMPDEFLRYYE